MTLVAFSACAGSRIRRLSALSAAISTAAAFGGFGAHGGDRNVARRLLLQQQLGRLDHRIAVEAIAHAAFEDDVGDRHHRHALMVGHVVEDDGVVGAFRHALRREVDGVVEAEMAERADRAQPLEIGDRLARLELRGKHCRIGRDHGVLRQPALQAQAGHAEIRVLVGHLAVAGVVGRFRDAPRDALGAARTGSAA